MTTKWKLTVRFVLERDFEIETKDDYFASFFQVGDWMVSSGCCGYTEGHVVNDSIFDRPISRWRPVDNMHPHDATLYNITESGMYDDDVTAGWLVEKIE